ncbi:transposase [Burkholderia pseudomallei]|nr:MULTISPECIES: transposase [pseudomallei group]MBM5594719.1 transposase [Burkholderia pseudomallei]MBO3032391.1 transposase [Burkholderia pseudomallei]MBO3049431.1 transposase [Burkholderia pseudomallei]MBO3056668.1 transposase [Burkholderia pseudomallei]MBO7756224.1 transposase [Burkholderia pseudomallei]
MPIIFEVMDTTLSDPMEKQGGRKGRPNHSAEFRRRLAMTACEPGISVAKLAREHGLNANLVFTCRPCLARSRLPDGGSTRPRACVQPVAS